MPCPLNAPLVPPVFTGSLGHPKAEAYPDDLHSWSGTLHLFAMYNKALTANEVKRNYNAYLPDSLPVVRDVYFKEEIEEDTKTEIKFSVGEHGGATIFDFDDVSAQYFLDWCPLCSCTYVTTLTCYIINLWCFILFFFFNHTGASTGV